MSADLSHITFISAGAGCGKTHALTQILHQVLASGEVRASGVIATTFSVRAATELRERVRSHLFEQGSVAHAQAMAMARIGTVNSVCGALLLRFAFEAGLATHQQVLEEAAAERLLTEVLDDILAGDDLQRLLASARRLELADDWRKSLKDLIAQVRANGIAAESMHDMARHNVAELLGVFPPAAAGDLTARLLAEIERICPALQAAIEVPKPVGKTQTFLKTAVEFAHALRNDEASWADWLRFAKGEPQKGLQDEVAEARQLAASVLAHPRLHEDLRHYIGQLFAIGARALEAFALRKRELGALDFTDQEQLLLDLLDDPGVAQVLRDELDLLLVDEFQDTSPIQLALFLKLARYARRVYWVGDVKQAIYGFRGSDSALMQSVLARVQTDGGTTQVLDRSWRSCAPLVDLVNAAFVPAFAGTLDRAKVALTALRASAVPGAALALWQLGGRNKEQRQAALVAGVQGLMAVGQWVAQKQTEALRPLRLADIAILCRANETVAQIAAALRAAGIPAATNQAGLLQTPEAMLALACLRRLNDPGDTLATAEILQLADAAEPEAWVSERLAHLQAKGDENQWRETDSATAPAHPLLARLAQWRAQLPLLSPREALQTVLVQARLDDIVLRWSHHETIARQRLANLDALLDMAVTYEDLCRDGQHAASISGLLIWLGEVQAQGQDALAQPSVDAVQVMTHHGAKGLEWPVTILMDLQSPLKSRLWGLSARSPAGFDATAPLRDRTVRFWPWPFGAQKAVPGLTDALAASPLGQAYRAAAVEEEKRLLYVSMTRARDLLVLMQEGEPKPDGWIGVLDAPWLLDTADADAVHLPDGTTVARQVWELQESDVTAGEATATPLYQWTAAEAGAPRAPLVVSPSALSGSEWNPRETAAVGTPICVTAGADMQALGIAVHACLAASFTDPAAPLTLPDVAGLLAGYGVPAVVDPAAVLHQVQALHGWIAARYGPVSAWAEIPVQQHLASGQQLMGRIDLLLETAQGWVVVDHKSTQVDRAGWAAVAQLHTGQLGAYAQALRAATGTAVREVVVFLPVAAGVVVLGETRPD